MVMDKGLSVRETEDFISVAGSYLDIVKLGFGSAYVTPHLTQKIEIYQRAGIPVYFGGTLLEAFLVRGQLDEYKRTIDKYKITHLEVSDGALDIPHEEKCKLIATFAKDYTVLSEVGSKDAEIIFAPYKWIQLMKDELAAGSWKVIADAVRQGMWVFSGVPVSTLSLIDEILTQVPADKILWEAPTKRSRFGSSVSLAGSNVNLGNIAYNEVYPPRNDQNRLRADTFFNFLDPEKSLYKQQEPRKPHQ